MARNPAIALEALLLIAVPTVIFLEIGDWQDNKITPLRGAIQALIRPTRATIKQLAGGYVFCLVVGLFLLKPFFDWVGQNATIINALSTAAAAIGTLIYVALTYFLLTATVDAYKNQQQPYVSVYLEASKEQRWGLEMVIHNQGNGPATDIGFTVNTDYKIYDGMRGTRPEQVLYLRDVPALNGLKYLAPQQQIRFYFGFLGNLPKDHTVNTFDVDVRYWDKDKAKAFADTFPITMTEFGTPVDNVRAEVDIAASLATIAQVIDRATDPRNVTRTCSTSPRRSTCNANELQRGATRRAWGQAPYGRGCSGRTDGVKERAMGATRPRGLRYNASTQGNRRSWRRGSPTGAWPC